MHQNSKEALARSLVFYLSLLLSSILFAGHLSANSGRNAIGPVKLEWLKSTANLLAAVPPVAEKRGLKIESINLSIAQHILGALASGQLDIGLLTSVHLRHAIYGGIDALEVAGKRPGNTGLVVSRRGIARDVKAAE